MLLDYLVQKSATYSFKLLTAGKMNLTLLTAAKTSVFLIKTLAPSLV